MNEHNRERERERTESKDWIGNRNSIYTTLGASNHTDKDRQQHDYYATEPRAMELLSKVLEQHGFEVISTDLIYRGFGDPEPLDFLKDTLEDFEGDIITNPPYKYALQFVEQALNSVQPGRKVAMFLKLQFLEGKSRKQFFIQNPPKTVYVSSSRLICAMNGEFEKYPSSAVAYAWFVWEKGFKGDPIIKWIN